jgi:hypothetical protein
MLTPLRPLSPDLLTLEVRPPSLAVDRGIVPVAVRQVIVFGPPCWLRLRHNACEPDVVLSPLPRPGSGR